MLKEREREREEGKKIFFTPEKEGLIALGCKRGGGSQQFQFLDFSFLKRIVLKRTGGP